MHECTEKYHFNETNDTDDCLFYRYILFNAYTVDLIEMHVMLFVVCTQKSSNSRSNEEMNFFEKCVFFL